GGGGGSGGKALGRAAGDRRSGAGAGAAAARVAAAAKRMPTRQACAFPTLHSALAVADSCRDTAAACPWTRSHIFPGAIAPRLDRPPGQPKLVSGRGPQRSHIAAS